MHIRIFFFQHELLSFCLILFSVFLFQVSAINEIITYTNIYSKCKCLSLNSSKMNLRTVKWPYKKKLPVCLICIFVLFYFIFSFRMYVGTICERIIIRENTIRIPTVERPDRSSI